MVEIICKRSGLIFQAENRRNSVHPSISYYTTHKDQGLRYVAAKTIARGLSEGWATLERFEVAIKVDLNPPPPPEAPYDFEGTWLAKITGRCEKFDYVREFQDCVEERGRFKRFRFGLPGIYQTNYKSAKGNDTRHFVEVLEDGTQTDITEAEVVKRFGDRPVTEELDLSGLEKIETEYPLGQVGETVKVGDRFVVIEKTETKIIYHDEDGIAHSRYPSGVFVVEEEHVTVNWVRSATESEAKIAADKLAVKSAGLAAFGRAKEIFGQSAETPIAGTPTGLKISVRDKVLGYDSPYLQVDTNAGLLWSVIYNGRDGDLWSLSNYGNSIARSQKLESNLVLELLEISDAIGKLHPEAIQHAS